VARCIQKPFLTEYQGRSLLNPEFDSMNQSHCMTAVDLGALGLAAPIAVNAM
jgi:hypothetical protein